MGSRRRGRELALQSLYRLEVSDDGDPTLVDELADHFGGGEAATNFARSLVSQVEEDRTKIDALIEQSLEKWSLDRLSRVERSALRVATAELLRAEDPVAVIITEAIEVVRRFGGDGAESFVNGVLDRVAREVGAAAPVAVEAGPKY